jgi:hypothetical protein
VLGEGGEAELASMPVDTGVDNSSSILRGVDAQVKTPFLTASLTLTPIKLLSSL